MDQIYDNRYYSAGSREPSSRRAGTVQLGGSDYAGVDRRAQRPASASRPRAQMNMPTDRPPRSARPTHAQRPSAQTHEKSTRPSSRLSGSDFMRYANDNAVVKAIYDFTHGPQRGLFIGIVVVLALVSLYFPVRDLYVAKRSSDILAKQVEIRQQYNDDLQKSVDKLLSEEGIKDAATEDLGLVMPGETKIDVLGLDDDSDPSSSKKSSNAKKASEVAKETEEVGKDAPWYIQTLDMLFGFNGVEGQTVVSNGK
jgi:cell division protein FtsL